MHLLVNLIFNCSW